MQAWPEPARGIWAHLRIEPLVSDNRLYRARATGLQGGSFAVTELQLFAQNCEASRGAAALQVAVACALSGGLEILGSDSVFKTSKSSSETLISPGMNVSIPGIGLVWSGMIWHRRSPRQV